MDFKRVDSDTVANFLEGVGPLKDLKHVRTVEANNWKPQVDVFIREPEAKKSTKRTYSYKPFIYAKKFDFSEVFTDKHIEVAVNDHSEDLKYFLYEGKKYESGVDAQYLKKNEWNDKLIYKVHLHSIEERKKYFAQKAKEYNVEIKELKIDKNVPRLNRGYRFLFHINKPEKRNASSSNPLFKYRNNGKIQKLNGSYKDLLNFFAEGGVNVYERRGTFFSTEKLEKFEHSTIIQDKFKFFFQTFDLFKKSTPGLDIEDIFSKKPDFNYLLRIINKNFKQEIKDFFKNNFISVVAEEDESYQLRHLIKNTGTTGFLIKGDYGNLYLTDKTEADNVSNEYSFLYGYKKFFSDWQKLEKYIEPHVKKLAKFLEQNHYSKIVIPKSYEDMLGDNYYSFIVYLQEYINQKLVENNRGKVSDLTEANVAKYIDILGIDRVLAKCNLNEIKVELNLEFIAELNKNNRSDSFSLYSTVTGRKAIDVFKYYGYDILDQVDSKFFNFNTTTQFMIQTGVSLFKELDFSDLNILTFDIETKAQEEFEWDKRAALFPEKGWIFQIGISTTKGFSKVLHADNHEEEYEIIKETYEIIRELDPDMVLGYNSENFDWPYLEKRYSILSGHEDIDETYDEIRDLLYDEDLGVFKWNFNNKRNSTLKVGGAVEEYSQTNMYGKAILDGWHGIKKLQAIDKRDSLSLKWNVKYEKIDKPNRVYVPGDLIGEIGKDDREYFFCDENGDWFVNELSITSQSDLYSKDGINRDENGILYYGKKSNLYINTINGLDSEINGCQNVISFNGNIQMFENSLYVAMKDFKQLVIPKKRFGIEYKKDKKRFNEIIDLLLRIKTNFKNLNRVYSHLDFSKYEKVSGKYIIERYLLDDLWETVELFRKTGQSSYMLGSWVMIGPQRVYTMGYATMWKIIITCWFYHNSLGVPDFEEYRKINGGLIGMFKAGYSRGVVKYDASSLYPSVKLAYLPAPKWDIMGITDGLLYHYLSTRLKYKALKSKYYKEGDFAKSKMYGILEQPLKIFINSYYGFLGAWTVSPYSDTLTAHGITAISRQVARHMIDWFEKRGFEAIYSHTDGINFIYPENVDEYKYLGTGKNWLVKKDKVYVGLEAYVSEYNDVFMEDKMGIDIDGIDYACINIAKSNVVHLKMTKKGKEIDIVGGLLKKDTKKYIRNFIDAELKNLLLGDAKGYVKNYVDYLLRLSNHNIKGVDIADFVKIKSLSEYETLYKNRMAVYELVKIKKIKYEPGSLFYYYNNGKSERDFTEEKDVVGTFVFKDYNESYLEQLIDLFNCDRKKFKDKVYSASKSIVVRNDYTTGKEYETKNFIFSSKRLSINKMLEMGLNDLADQAKTTLKDLDKEKSYPKTFFLDDIDNWDSFLIKKKIHKKHGVTLQLIMVNDRLNVTNLPLDEHENKVEYNVQKYVDQFYKAIEPLQLVFNEDVRTLLLNIKNGVKFFGENWLEKYVNDRYDKDYNDLNDIMQDLDFNMVNGIPLAKKQENQQEKADILDIDPVEYSYWNDSKMHPYWFLNKKMIDGDEFYIDQNLDYTYEEKCSTPFAVCDRMGLIQHYAKNNFKAI